AHRSARCAPGRALEWSSYARPPAQRWPEPSGVGGGEVPASRQPVFRLLSSSVLFSESFLNPSGAPVMRHADKLKLVEGLCGDLHLDPGVVLPKALYVMELNQPVWHDD